MKDNALSFGEFNEILQLINLYKKPVHEMKTRIDCVEGCVYHIEFMCFGYNVEFSHDDKEDITMFDRIFDWLREE